MYNVSFSHKANKELNDAIDWYEEQQDGLGKRLSNEIEKKLIVISKQPDRYPIVKKNVRQVKIGVFPYQILYFVREDILEIVVQSIFHTKRNPSNKY